MNVAMSVVLSAGQALATDDLASDLVQRHPELGGRPSLHVGPDRRAEQRGGLGLDELAAQALDRAPQQP
jgi:hypothetical protein